MEHNKQFVVLEHLTMPHRGLRFWTRNSDNNTHSFNGELWYKEILFTDDRFEAIKESAKCGKLPDFNELEEYYKTHPNE